MPTRSTLLEAVMKAQGDEKKVKRQLRSGELELTGNFKGKEAQVAGKPPTKIKTSRSRTQTRIPKAPLKTTKKRVATRMATGKSRPFKQNPVGGGYASKPPTAPKAPPHLAPRGDGTARVTFKASDGDFSKAARQSKNFNFSYKNPYVPSKHLGSTFNKYGGKPKTTGKKLMEAWARAAKKGALAARASAPVLKAAGKVASRAALPLAVATIPAQARGYAKASDLISKKKYRKGIATALQTFTGTRGMKEKIPNWVKQPK